MYVHALLGSKPCQAQLTCSLSRTHLIRTCFVDFDRSIVLVAEAWSCNMMWVLYDLSCQRWWRRCLARVSGSCACILHMQVTQDGEKMIVGAGRVSREQMSNDVTFALQVLPSFRRKSLGSVMPLGSEDSPACQSKQAAKLSRQRWVCMCGLKLEG